jgi:hypothetical protein
MNDYDAALAKLLALWDSCGGHSDAFYEAAHATFGYSQEELDWIEAVVGSAKFRAAFGNVVASHTTDFENDPWFLAAQCRFPAQARKPWWKVW